MRVSDLNHNTFNEIIFTLLSLLTMNFSHVWLSAHYKPKVVKVTCSDLKLMRGKSYLQVQKGRPRADQTPIIGSVMRHWSLLP